MQGALCDDDALYALRRTPSSIRLVLTAITLRLPITQGALCDDDAGVRTAAGGVFNVLFKSGGGSAMDSVIPALLSGLDSDAHSAQVGRGVAFWCGGRVLHLAGRSATARCPVHGIWRWLAVYPAGQVLEGLCLMLGVSSTYTLQLGTSCADTRSLHYQLQALEGLRVVLGVRPQLLSVMVPRLIKPPVTSTNLRALGALAEVAGKEGLVLLLLISF